MLSNKHEFEVTNNMNHQNLSKELLYVCSRVTREIIFTLCKNVHDQDMRSHIGVLSLLQKDLDQTYFEVITAIVEKAAPFDLP